MSVSHIVLFAFKPEAAPEAVTQCCHELLALRHKSLKAESQEPYILSIKGGKDNSIEGLQNGFTHAFIVEFASAADRDYYVTEAAHRAFVDRWIAGADGIAAKAMVVDFEGGAF